MNQLKANLKSAAELVSLPTTVEELQKVKALEQKKKSFMIAFTQESINISFFMTKTDWSFSHFDFSRVSQRSAAR